jgi:hypothetical protein
MKKFAVYGLVLLFIFTFSKRSLAQYKEAAPLTVKGKTMHPPPIPYFSINRLCYGDTTLPIAQQAQIKYIGVS